MNATVVRAFFAIDLPVEYKQQLGSRMAALQQHLRNVLKRDALRWIRPQNLHLTLQFLGQVDAHALTALLQSVRAELAQLPPFYLRFGSLEWFPSRYRPQVLSLQAGPHAVLAELALLLRETATALHYPVDDRPFRGHLSLARVTSLHPLHEEWLNTFSGMGVPEVLVKEVVLFRSELQGGGSIYTRLANMELEGPRSLVDNSTG